MTAEGPNDAGFRLSTAAMTAATATPPSSLAPACSRRRLSDAFWRRPEAAALPDAGAAAALARHRLSRLAVRAAAAELLLDRRVLRPDQPRVHAEDLWRAAAAGEPRHHRAHRHHGGAGDAGLRRHRLPDRLFRGPLRARQMEGAVLSRRHAAAVVELPGQGLCLEADPRQGRHSRLVPRQGPPDMAARRVAVAAGRRGQFAVGVVHRHLHRLRLCLAALHDPADAGRAGARAGLAGRGLGRSRRAAGPDLPQRDLPAGAARHRRGLDLHLLADARRLHHPADHRHVAAVHRPGRLRAPGHRRQHPARRRLHGGADRHHGALSVGAKRMGAFDAL